MLLNLLFHLILTKKKKDCIVHIVCTFYPPLTDEITKSQGGKVTVKFTELT